MDIRLMQATYEYGGKTYLLRCNMAVVADVQEECGGDLLSALDHKSSLRSKLMFLAAMMNDYADEQGWPDRFSWRKLGRTVHLQDSVLQDVSRLVAAEILKAPDEGTTNADNDAGKN